MLSLQSESEDSGEQLQYQQELVEKVRSSFAKEPNFIFEKLAGSGAFGVTCCLSNRSAGPDDYQKIIVKVQPEGTLAEERGFLKPFKWAQHIATLLDPALTPTTRRWIAQNGFITEYVENGTLYDFKGRLGNPRALPNRLLWSIFLCLVQACIGMAYPPGDPNEQPRGPRDQIPETLPTDGRPPFDVEHCDLHEGNVMIGDFDSGEHSLFPLLKVIDFGLSIHSDEAVEENIGQIGRIMCSLMWRGDIATLLSDKIQGGNLDPTLDIGLLTLATDCCREKPADRPSLSQLLAIVGPGTRKTYPNIPQEDDIYITSLIQNFLLNPGSN